MTSFWQWFLVVGASIIFLANVIAAVMKLIRYLKNGKRNADVYFEKRVKKIIDCVAADEYNKYEKQKAAELKIFSEVIMSELKPIKESIEGLKTLGDYLQHAVLTDLKIKLRKLYHESFEKNGSLTKCEKVNWDKWFSDYSHLGGNSDIKTMDDYVQKVHYELTIEMQKGKTKKKKELIIEEETVYET